MFELVRVGRARLFGEVIRLAADTATIQVFEETTGLALGEPVERTGGPVMAELGPGLLGSVLDGVGRPLERLAERTGAFIAPGAALDTLARDREWTFEARREPGARVEPADILGTVTEPTGFVHPIPSPPGVRGVLREARSGRFRLSDPVGWLEDGTPLSVFQRWPVRRPRPVVRRSAPERPFFTGQRVLDLLFPVAEGGTVVVPGGFGTGKTVIEQALAKFGTADVVVFVGCGERGNEMAELLAESPLIRDPATGRSILERTVLVVNTSNMPVAAREASIYLGLTVAEYFRDLGLHVAVMADSLSRWAEALREIGSRLGELPGEEGYPTYLPNRLAQLYERAGRAVVLGSPERQGAVTFVSAVSPPGGDFSEPETQASLRVAGALWALDPALAHQRQFPAVDWSASYRHYVEETAPWFIEQGGADWPDVRRALSELLQREGELREIAGLVGLDALDDHDRVLLDVGSARSCSDRARSIPRTRGLRPP
ncbi:MAG: V-type ATP synthase subunit A, partial [Gemmatimonadota bacterium]